VTALATLDRPALNGVLQEAAGRAGLDLVLLTLDELRAAAHLCVTHSEHSMKQYGIPSVAEAAALAGAGAGARLLIPRFVGRNATASVAGRP
jgi:cobalt-precorrin 5A hydrolase